MIGKLVGLISYCKAPINQALKEAASGVRITAYLVIAYIFILTVIISLLGVTT